LTSKPPNPKPPNPLRQAARRLVGPGASPGRELSALLSQVQPPTLPRLQSTVTTGVPADVTRIGHEERTSLPIEALWRDVESLYLTGLHPSIALHVRHRGVPILDRTIGHLDNPPDGVPGAITTPDTLYNLFSGSKIVTAVAIHALIEDGVIGLDDRVAQYLPAFSPHGKDRIRIRHLLNHTAGIPDMPPGTDVDAFLERGEVPWPAVWDLRPLSKPGRNVAYHPMTSWFLLERILREATGLDLRAYVRQRLLEPLGFEHMNFGVAPELVPLVARHAVTGPPVPGPAARIFERTIGIDLEQAVRLINQPAALTAIMPSANVIARPREATRFMQMLLQGGQLDGVRVLQPETVHRMVTEVTPRQIDSTFGFPVRYGLGVMMGGTRFSLFGLNTAGAYGHLGLSNVVVYADPARELSVAFLNTGKPILAPGMLRWYWVLQRIALMVPRQ
jgi:CubicO group peptidase (beta-lactamase class C family)